MWAGFHQAAERWDTTVMLELVWLILTIGTPAPTSLWKLKTDLVKLSSNQNFGLENSKIYSVI
jgi:hypothetical protein